MNITAVITASGFLLFSLAALVFLFVGKGPFCTGAFRAFYRAACGVYSSGALLVLIFTLVMDNLPVIFVVISDLTIFMVFVFTTLLIFFTTKKLLASGEKAEASIDAKESKEASEETDSKGNPANE